MKRKIDSLMKKQPFPNIKNKERKIQSEEVLLALGIKRESEFFEFYTTYFGRNLKHREGASTIIDPSPPQKSLLKATNMAHVYWNIPKEYILFTTGEGDGGYLYNINDNSVWDFTLGQQELLGTSNMQHWDSFYEFMIWYLTLEE